MADLRKLSFAIDFKDVNSSPIEKTDKAMDKVKDSMEKIKKKAPETGKSIGDAFKAAGKSAGKIGKSLTTKMTLPIVGVGAAALKVTSNFDDAMANVQKISGATGKEFDALRDKAKELGATTAFSASEASDGMGVLAASGMAVNDILESSGDMFNLMSAGSVTADTAASILTNTMAQFKLEAKDSGYIVDTFAATSAKAKISVDGLEHGMALAGNTLASMNMSAHESTAVFGHLANAGVPVEQLGSAVNAMGREIKANASDFKKLGVEVYDAQGKLRTMPDVMSDLEKSLEGKTDAERDSALASVFSGQAMQGATAWIKQGSDAYSKLTDEIVKEKNAAETMAAIQEDTIGGAFRAVKSASEGMMIEIGDVIKKPIQAIAKGIAKAAGAFGKLSSPMKKVIVIFAGIAVAIGPALLIFSKVVEFGPRIASAFTKVGTVLGGISAPVLIVVGAIAVLTGVMVHLWKTNEEFRDKVIGVWETIKTSLSTALEFIKGLWETHGEAIKTKVSEIFDTIGVVIMGAIDFISETISIGVTWIKEFWAEHGEFIKTTALNAWEMISTTVGEFVEVIKEVVGAALDWIQEFWSNHGETLMSIASSAWDLITGLISAAMAVIQGAIDVVLGVIQGDWSRVWTGIQGIFEGVMDGISAAWNFVKGLLGKVMEGTVNAITDKFHSAMESVEEKWESMKAFLKNPIKGTVSIVEKGLNKIKGKGADGTHATGAYNIPFDGYLGELHKGEMVLTKSASDAYRSMGGTEDSLPKIANTTTYNTSTTTVRGEAPGSDKSPIEFNFNPQYNIEVKGDMGEQEVGNLKEVMKRLAKESFEEIFYELQLKLS